MRKICARCGSIRQIEDDTENIVSCCSDSGYPLGITAANSNTFKSGASEATAAFYEVHKVGNQEAAPNQIPKYPME